MLIRYSGTERKARVMVEGTGRGRSVVGSMRAGARRDAPAQSWGEPDASHWFWSWTDWPGLREVTGAEDVDLAAAATLAELAGVDGVRLGVNAGPQARARRGRASDARRAARRLELRMPPTESLLKVALEVPA